MARSDGPVVVCVINLKGGVGKSTISALLARHGFTRRNLDVLAIDLDPQANLSQGLMHNGYTVFLHGNGASIVELFNGYMPPSSKSSKPTPLTAPMVTQSISVGTGRALDLIPSRFDFSDNLLGAVSITVARFLDL